MNQQQLIELWGGIGILGFLAFMVMLVHLMPTDDDTGTPLFVWVAGFVLFVAACTLFSAAGLIGFN